MIYSITRSMLQPKDIRKSDYYPVVTSTQQQQWIVEANTAEEAVEKLIESGQTCGIGDFHVFAMDTVTVTCSADKVRNL